MMANLTAYRAMARKTQRHGLPKVNASVFAKLDKEMLESKAAPKRFIWVLREQGTWIATNWDILIDREAVCCDYGKEEVRFYVWDRHLREVSQLSAIKLLRRLQYPHARRYVTIQDARQEYEQFYHEAYTREEIMERERQNGQGSSVFGWLGR